MPSKSARSVSEVTQTTAANAEEGAAAAEELAGQSRQLDAQVATLRAMVDRKSAGAVSR